MTEGLEPPACPRFCYIKNNVKTPKNSTMTKIVLLTMTDNVTLLTTQIIGNIMKFGDTVF